jgi:hypothetical protein
MKTPNQHFVNKFDNTNAFAQQMSGGYQYGNMTPNQYSMYPQMQNESMQQQYSMNYQNQMQNMNMAPNQESEQGTEQDTTGESLDKVILDSL